MYVHARMNVRSILHSATSGPLKNSYCNVPTKSMHMRCALLILINISTHKGQREQGATAVRHAYTSGGRP